MYRCVRSAVARVARVRGACTPARCYGAHTPDGGDHYTTRDTTAAAAASSSSSVVCAQPPPPPPPPPPPLITGDVARGLIDNIRVTWTDMPGVDGLAHTRMAAGRLLGMADMCAAQVAHKTALAAQARLRQGDAADTTWTCTHTSDTNSNNNKSSNSSSRDVDATAAHVAQRVHTRLQVCTVAVTHTDFRCPIVHGDAVCMEGRAVHCGSSAIGVHIRFFRLASTARTRTPAGESFFTMVLITPDLQPAKVVPAMRLTSAFDVAMHRRYAAILAMQRENAATMRRWHDAPLCADAVQCPVNASKRQRVPMPSTTTRANRIFFSAHLNNNNTVFGGELMAWMERHATRCGRVFTGQPHVYTLRMHNVVFKEPVFATDWVTLEASVIYVRNTTMEVDVTLHVERDGCDGVVITNRASFILIATDEVGQKTPIACGIDLHDASPEQLRRFLAARERYKLSVRHRAEMDAILRAVEAHDDDDEDMNSNNNGNGNGNGSDSA